MPKMVASMHIPRLSVINKKEQNTFSCWQTLSQLLDDYYITTVFLKHQRYFQRRPSITVITMEELWQGKFLHIFLQLCQSEHTPTSVCTGKCDGSYWWKRNHRHERSKCLTWLPGLHAFQLRGWVPAEELNRMHKWIQQFFMWPKELQQSLTHLWNMISQQCNRSEVVVGTLLLIR